MLSFDSFSEQLHQHQWVPLVQRLVCAEAESLESLAQLLDPMPSVGHYRLIALIGHGGMARVFAAWDAKSNRPVAIKLFEPKHEEVWSLIQRFQNEANAMGRMEHPHIVSLLDRGNQRGRVYFVMNLVVGSSLSELYHYWRHGLRGESEAVKESLVSRMDTSERRSDSVFHNISLSSSSSRPDSQSFRDSSCTTLESVSTSGVLGTRAAISPSMVPRLFRDVEPYSDEHYSIVIQVGLEVCDALRYSHQKGVLHRDIKPSNLLLDEEGRSWVMDFGLASVNWRAGSSTDERLTRHGDLLGTIAYMSVGAVEGEYSEQSDLYSLGATLYELATLRPVWHGHREGDILKKLFDRSLPPLGHLHECKVPNELSKVIECLLNAEMSQVMPTAKQMHLAFKALADGRTPELPSGTYGIKLRTRQLINRWYKPSEWIARTTIWLVLVLAFAVVMGYKLYSEHRVLATEASSLHGSLQRRVDQTIYSVQLLKQFAENVEEFQPDNFASFAQPVLDNNLEVVSVVFAESGGSPERENGGRALNSAVRIDGNRRGGSVLVTHLETRENQKLRLEPGADLMTDSRFREVIKEASFTGAFAVTGPVDLGERGAARTAFVLAQRVDRVDRPRSFILVLVRVDQILETLELPESEERLLVRVRANQVAQPRSIYEGDQQGVAFKFPPASGNPDFEFDVLVGGTRWKLSMFLANPWSQSNASLLLSTFLFAIVLPLPVLLTRKALGWIRQRRSNP